MEGFRKESGGGSEELRQIQQEIGRIHEEGRRTLEDGKISRKDEKNREECGRKVRRLKRRVRDSR